MTPYGPVPLEEVLPAVREWARGASFEVPLPCGPVYFDGCTCPSCSQYRNEAWAGRVPKLTRAQLEARIAHAREMGDLEPLRPAPRVSWVEELRLRQLLWDLEDLSLDSLPRLAELARF